MKKLLLVLSLLLMTTSAHAVMFRLTAKNLKFKAIDGPGYCNGIKAYSGKKFLFNLGYPECNAQSHKNFSDTSFEHIKEIANELNEFVKMSFDDDTELYVESLLFAEYDPPFFISKVKK